MAFGLTPFACAIITTHAVQISVPKLRATLPIFCAALWIGSSAWAADAALERERQQLRSQRDQAVKAAVEPIDRRYQASLEQLLRKAMQNNDLDTAVKIKQDLAALKAGGPENELEKQLFGKWRIRNPRNGWTDEWTINPDGTIHTGRETHRWVVEGDQFKVKFQAGQTAEFKLPVRNSKLSGKDNKGEELSVERQSH
jgi:hypothetical protein